MSLGTWGDEFATRYLGYRLQSLSTIAVVFLSAGWSSGITKALNDGASPGYLAYLGANHRGYSHPQVQEDEDKPRARTQKAQRVKSIQASR